MKKGLLSTILTTTLLVLTSTLTEAQALRDRVPAAPTQVCKVSTLQNDLEYKTSSHTHTIFVGEKLEVWMKAYHANFTLVEPPGTVKVVVFKPVDMSMPVTLAAYDKDDCYLASLDLELRIYENVFEKE